MEIWFDSCDRKAIIEACRFGFIYGVTTNPSLIAQANENPEKILSALLEIQDGPVAVQITVNKMEEIIQRSLALHTFSDRILVKIPLTKEGLKAMKVLAEQEVAFLATAVYHPSQALLAALAQSDYIAPYVGRIFDTGADAYAVLKSITSMYQQQKFKTKILAAGLKTAEQVQACAEMGIHAVTLKPSVFEQWTADNNETLNSLKEFTEAWESKDCIRSTVLAL